MFGNIVNKIDYIIEENKDILTFLLLEKYIYILVTYTNKNFTLCENSFIPQIIFVMSNMFLQGKGRKVCVRTANK